jgi:hypothetical protein
MSFPKIAQLRHEYARTLKKRETALYKENKTLVDNVVKTLGEKLMKAAQEGSHEAFVTLTDANGTKVAAPFASEEEFDTLVRIVRERLTDWDAFKVTSFFHIQSIYVTWDVDDVYSQSGQ